MSPFHCVQAHFYGIWEQVARVLGRGASTMLQCAGRELWEVCRLAGEARSQEVMGSRHWPWIPPAMVAKYGFEVWPTRDVQMPSFVQEQKHTKALNELEQSISKQITAAAACSWNKPVTYSNKIKIKHEYYMTDESFLRFGFILGDDLEKISDALLASLDRLQAPIVMYRWCYKQ